MNHRIFKQYLFHLSYIDGINFLVIYPSILYLEIYTLKMDIIRYFTCLYLIPPSLSLSNIRYVSRVKWNNPGKRVSPSPTPQCCSNWKGSLLVALDYSCQLYLLPVCCKNLNNVNAFFCISYVLYFLSYFISIPSLFVFILFSSFFFLSSLSL